MKIEDYRSSWHGEVKNNLDYFHHENQLVFAHDATLVVIFLRPLVEQLLVSHP